MKRASKAIASIAWASAFRQIIVTYHSGAVWAYPGSPQEYATMHRTNVSAGKYVNRVLKPRVGVQVKARPMKPHQARLVSVDTALLSAAFIQATGL